jgi:hypothetical protein
MPAQKLPLTSLFTKGDAIFTLGSLSYWMIHFFVFFFSYISPKLGITSLPKSYFEFGDKIAFIGLVATVIAVSSGFASPKLGFSRWATNGALKLICLTIFLLSTIALPTHLTTPTTTFTGFGTSVALLVTLILPAMLIFVSNQQFLDWINRHSQSAISVAGTALAIVVAFIYLLA